jgi:hypothetical protein
VDPKSDDAGPQPVDEPPDLELGMGVSELTAMHLHSCSSTPTSKRDELKFHART